MHDQLKMLLLAVGTTYLVFRIGHFLRSLLHAYRLWVVRCRALDDLDHPGSGDPVQRLDIDDTCTRDSGEFSPREFSDF